MNTYVTHATSLALCYSKKFRPSKSHLQAVRLIHFDSQINKMCVPDLTFRGPCIVIYSYNKTNELH
jgi:hypothetical protein